jgi:DNA-binding transcriptional LysR family regulator
MALWKGIEEYISVVETGSFSKAAERMEVTVSQVSKRISVLEKKLNVRLLDRSTREVNPTTQGKLFYQSCRKLITEFSHACEDIQLDKGTLTGQLRLCSVGGSRPAFQLDLYRAFLDKYPGLSMEVTYSDHIPSLAREGLDLALVIGDIDITRVERGFHLCWIDYVLVASPSLLETLPLPAEPSDCSSLPCILNGEDHWRLSNGNTSVRVPVSGRFSSLNMPACIDACLSGLGVFMVPAYAANNMVDSGRVVQLLPEWHIRKSMYAVLPSKEYVPAKVILLMEFMDETMGIDTGEAGKLRQMLQETGDTTMQILREMNNGMHQVETTAMQNRSK